MQFDFQRVSVAVFSTSLSLLLAAGVWALLTQLSYQPVTTETVVSQVSEPSADVLSEFTYEQSNENVETSSEPFNVESNVPELTNNRSLVLFGYKNYDVYVRATINDQVVQEAGGDYGEEQWEMGVALNEGQNHIFLEAFDVQGLLLASKDFNVKLDTKRPTCRLNYPSQVAGQGAFRISLNCTEAINPRPKIYIDQKGSVDVYAALMNGGGANWYFDYFVKQDNGKEYVDGQAIVEVVTNSDLAGNPLDGIQNTTFLISTKNSGTQPTTTPTPVNDGNTDVIVLPETGDEEEEAKDRTEQNEENSTVLPKVTIHNVSFSGIDAKYRNGSVVRIQVEYSADRAFNSDSKLEAYSYIGKSSTTINNGLIADFSALDSEYSNRAVRVSARRELGNNRFVREVRYHISPENSKTLPLSANVTVNYRLNGNRVATSTPLQIRVVPDAEAVLKVERMNDVEISNNEPPEMSTDVLAKGGYTLRGTATPNSRISLQIFSDPIVAETVTDDQGNWEYTLTQELEPGDHTVYAALIESDEVPQDYVEVLSFSVVSPVVALEVAADDGTLTETGDLTVSDVTSTVTESSPLRVIVYIVIATAVVSGLLLLVYRMRTAAPNDKIFTN